MGNLIYVYVTVLVNSWIIGFVGYGAGSYIHILLAIVFGVLLSRVVQGRRLDLQSNAPVLKV